MNKLKEDGNQAFKVGDYIKAHELYTKAIDMHVGGNATSEHYHVLLSNRIINNFKLRKYDAAVYDANDAIAQSPNFVKVCPCMSSFNGVSIEFFLIISKNVFFV